MDSSEERAHWRDVLRAFDGYMQYHLAINHNRRVSLLRLPRGARAMFEAVGYRDKLDAVDEGIRANADFIDLLIRDPVFADMLAPSEYDYHHPEAYQPDVHQHAHGGHTHSHGGHSHAHHPNPHTNPDRPDRDVQQDKVRSTLRSFVRDWAADGAAEREACYAPILAALEAHYPDTSRRGRIKVLTPGCGLGRLAMEIAARGFWSQGNEFSTYMLIASHFVLNQTAVAEEHTLFPWIHSFSNQKSTETHLLRSVRVPDVVPSEILSTDNAIAPGGFSLVAGDFEEVYGPAHWLDAEASENDHSEAEDADEDEDESRANQRGRWGAVVTCFFIDTARNILNYLRIIHTILADDGVWINLGPLLWHFESSAGLELSLDEVKDLARMVGFEIRHERTVDSTYTEVPDGMLEHVYHCAFWTATKVRPPAAIAGSQGEESSPAIERQAEEAPAPSPKRTPAETDKSLPEV